MSRRLLGVVALVLGVVVGLALLASVTAFAQDHDQESTGSLYALGYALSTLVTGLGVGAGGVHLLRARGASSPQPEGQAALFARLDERTASIVAVIGEQGKQLSRVAGRQERHGRALLLVLARDGHTPEEQAALAALADDSDEGAPTLPDRPTGPTVVPP